MRLIRKLFITVVGSILLLLGIVLLVLPGPAILVIPGALALLSLEYPVAKTWLRMFQRRMSQGARWADSRWRQFRANR